MARQDNVKIITTAVLVVLLLSSFILGFIYRNELYQKYQAISKTNSLENDDRIIEKEPAWTPPRVSNPNEKVAVTKESLNTNKVELPDLPSLDDMEKGIQPNDNKSVSVLKNVPIPKDKNTLSRDSVSVFDETKDMITKPKKLDTVVDTPKRKQTGSKLNEAPPPSKKTVHRPLPKKSTSVKYHKQKNRMSERTRTPRVFNPKKKITSTRSSLKSNPKGDPSLNARLENMESKFLFQNQKNDMRFSEIEKRIDKLEKTLGSN